MAIALFLDVDDTLTEGPIQSYFAQALGVSEEYERIEKAYQDRRISSDNFAREIIALYRGAQFDEPRCNDIASRVRLKSWSKQLLGLDKRPDVDVYLVSSGPSFYIDKLASRHDIPAERVQCTQYRFGRTHGLLSEEYDPIGPTEKGEYVRKMARKYPFSIGIGDHAEFDGPFLSHCTVKLLTMRSENYLYVPSFSIVLDLVKNFTHSTESVSVAGGDVKNGQASNALDVEKLQVGDIFLSLRRLTVSAALVLIGIMTGIGGALIALGRLFPAAK